MTLLIFKSLAFMKLAAENTDFLRSDGKIYSVVLGIVLIFLGIVLYIWRLDKKLTKLEIQIKDEHKTS